MMSMPRLVSRKAATVVGIGVATSNAAETNPATGKIGGLWTRFHEDDLLHKIPGKQAPAAPLAVYTDYESDQSGAYRLIVGAAVVDGGAPVPEGLQRATIPAGTYLLFEAEGEMPNVVIDTWKTIWNHFSDSSSHVRAYATDFEMYPGPGVVQIYVSIK
jgi:predicted transcriptional regulator YdeE